MLVGLGLDILHLPRLIHLVQRRGLDRLARRILTDAERSEWDSLPHAADHAGQLLVHRRLRYLAVR